MAPRLKPTLDMLERRRVTWLVTMLAHRVPLTIPPELLQTPDRQLSEFFLERTDWCADQIGQPCIPPNANCRIGALHASMFRTDGCWALWAGAWRFRDPTTATAFKLRWHGAE